MYNKMNVLLNFYFAITILCVVEMINYMNAASQTKEEGCKESNAYPEIPVSYRQSVFGDSHYAFSAALVNHDTCQAACRSIGFDLVHIYSVEENMFLGDLQNAHGTNAGFHVGIRRNAKNRTTWYWSDGTEYVMNTHMWVSEQPDDKGGNEDCAIQHTIYNHTWDDYDCTVQTNCMCSRPVTRNKQPCPDV